jgi:hypothetical protein
MLPRAAQALLVLAALAVLAILVLSPERDVWLILCGILLLVGLAAGWVIYRLLFRDRK